MFNPAPGDSSVPESVLQVGIISPKKCPVNVLPRKLITSLAPKHKLLWLSKREYRSLKSEEDLKTISVEY
jgi:hypothetical protein